LNIAGPKDIVAAAVGSARSFLSACNVSLNGPVSVPKPITLNFRSRPIRKGLRRVDFAEGTDVTVKYHSLHGHYEEISSIIDDAVRRGVALIGTPTALRVRCCQSRD
jgi:hypothetical protein